MAGSWDFTADSDIQKELSNNLNEAADKFDVKVSDMYKEIDSLGSNSYWVGEDYDAFKTGTEGYKNALQDLSDGIRMYGKHFEEMSGGTDTLATELISIVQNMTGANSSGGSTTPSSTPNSTTPSSTPSNTTPSSTPSNTTPSSTPSNTTPSSTPSNTTPSSTPSNTTPSSTPSNTPNNNVSSVDVTATDFMNTTAYAQWSSSYGSQWFLDDAMTIQYSDGKILYPDGHYEEIYIGNMYDAAKAWARVNGYNYVNE